MFVDCYAIMDYLACKGGQWHINLSLPVSLLLTHTNRHTTQQPVVDCRSVRNLRHLCCHHLRKACQKCFGANTDEATRLTDLWAICHPSSDGVRGGGTVLHCLRSRVRVFVLSPVVNIVHFMSHLANMSFLSGAQKDWAEKKQDFHSPLYLLCIVRLTTNIIPALTRCHSAFAEYSSYLYVFLSSSALLMKLVSLLKVFFSLLIISMS